MDCINHVNTFNMIRIILSSNNTNMDERLQTAAFPYSAIGISVFARFIFMYLLYTKKSVNLYSLAFCILNITSSGLWLKYSLETRDLPLTIRNSIDGFLLSICSVYILRNRYLQLNDMGVVNPEP